MWKLLLLLETLQLYSISANEAWEDATSIYDFYAVDQRKGSVDLETYKNHPILIVNTAASCELPENYYNQLTELYDKYGDRGLRIIVLPSRQFYQLDGPCVQWDRRLYPKTKEVKFDIFSRIDIEGPLAHPLWKYLNKQQPKLSSGPSGRFSSYNKFIINENGQPISRFGASVEPRDLEAYLSPYTD